MVLNLIVYQYSQAHYFVTIGKAEFALLSHKSYYNGGSIGLVPRGCKQLIDHFNILGDEFHGISSV